VCNIKCIKGLQRRPVKRKCSTLSPALKNCILVSYNRRQDMKEKRFEVRYRSEKGEGEKYINEKKEMKKYENREKFKVKINKICRIERKIKNNLIVY
jgi:hypothetical protein